MTDCLLCTEPLTMKNVINTNCCTMPCCKNCFFRWTKAKNTCPCCRANIFCNSEENKEIMHLKELLSHRSRIVRQVEESYDELDVIRAKKRRVDQERLKIKKSINEEKEKLEKLQHANGGKYKTIQYLDIRIRNGLENIRVESTNNKKQVLHHLKRSLVLFLSANRRNPGRFLRYKYFSVALKNFIRQERKRKLRAMFRQKRDNFRLYGTRLRALFNDVDEEPVANWQDLRIFRGGTVGTVMYNREPRYNTQTISLRRFIETYTDDTNVPDEDLETSFMRYFTTNY